MPPLATATFPVLAPHPVGFTSGLLEAIDLSKEKIDAWATNQERLADEASAKFHDMLKQEQASINANVQELSNLKEQRGMDESDESKRLDTISAQQRGLEGERDVLEAENISLEERTARSNEVIEGLSSEMLKHRQLAEKAAKRKEEAQKSKQITIDDLTQGLLCYHHLGLVFEKGIDGLCFVFTNIDENDAHRRFQFALEVTAENTYEVSQCLPALDWDFLRKVSTELDEAEDMSRFVRKMRHTFVEYSRNESQAQADADAELSSGFPDK